MIVYGIIINVFGGIEMELYNKELLKNLNKFIELKLQEVSSKKAYSPQGLVELSLL